MIRKWESESQDRLAVIEEFEETKLKEAKLRLDIEKEQQKLSASVQSHQQDLEKHLAAEKVTNRRTSAPSFSYNIFSHWQAFELERQRILNEGSSLRLQAQSLDEKQKEIEKFEERKRKWEKEKEKIILENKELRVRAQAVEV